MLAAIEGSRLAPQRDRPARGLRLGPGSGRREGRAELQLQRPGRASRRRPAALNLTATVFLPARKEVRPPVPTRRPPGAISVYVTFPGSVNANGSEIEPYSQAAACGGV